MTLALPIVLPVADGPVGYQCADCDTLDSDGRKSPRHLVSTGYGVVWGWRWLCHPCSVAVHARYDAAVRERKRLHRISAIVGYPVTRAQADAWERGQLGVQLELWGDR